MSTRRDFLTKAALAAGGVRRVRREFDLRVSFVRLRVPFSRSLAVQLVVRKEEGPFNGGDYSRRDIAG